jgi:hypothetical protein
MVLAVVLGGALTTTAVGCGKKKGCGPELDAAVSKANAAIGAEDPEAMRAAAGELEAAVDGATEEVLRYLPSALRDSAKQLEEAKDDGASFRASVKGFDAAVTVAQVWCEP